MAVVYSAYDLTLKRWVAVKILRADYSQNSAFCDQFRREATAAANLSHPNIVTVHDFGEDAGRIFIVMELIDGEDLKNAIRKKLRFSVPEAIHLIVQACNGIGYAHRAGIVHCDVKPHNMLVTPDQRLKMTDFGIARALTSINPDERSEEVWGSPEYFSPEQAAGLAPSPSSDVYSLGVVLYEMLTGKLPFIAKDRSELARMHREDRPTPPNHLNKEIPPELDQIIMKVLAKTPAQRYQTADQLSRLLAPFENINSTTPPVSVHPSSSTTQPTSSGANPQATRPAQSSATPAGPAPQRATPGQPRSIGTNFASLLAPDIIFLGILALFMVVGLIPFGLIVFVFTR